MTDAKTCISCGMPLRTPDDFPMKDASKDYCRHCARPDGTMKSYDEALVGMTGFLQQTQGVDGEVARTTARAMMAKMPAWRGRT